MGATGLGLGRAGPVKKMTVTHQSSGHWLAIPIRISFDLLGELIDIRFRFWVQSPCLSQVKADLLLVRQSAVVILGSLGQLRVHRLGSREVIPANGRVMTYRGVVAHKRKTMVVFNRRDFAQKVKSSCKFLFGIRLHASFLSLRLGIFGIAVEPAENRLLVKSLKCLRIVGLCRRAR